MNDLSLRIADDYQKPLQSVGVDGIFGAAQTLYSLLGDADFRDYALAVERGIIYIAAGPFRESSP